MKAISVIQPWATLIAIGAKKIETRSWPTSHRGPIAIHASTSKPRWANECFQDCCMQVLKKSGWKDLPRGCVVATANLDKCVQFTSVAKIERVAAEFGYEEIAYGDFSIGRYGWVLSNVVRLAKPVPAIGRLSLWDWEPTGTALMDSLFDVVREGMR